MEPSGSFEQGSNGADAAHAGDGKRYGAFDPFNVEHRVLYLNACRQAFTDGLSMLMYHSMPCSRQLRSV